MKTFKLIDITISISLITLFSSLLLLRNNEADNFSLIITAYCITGARQCASMIVHECTRCFVASRSARSIYHIISLLLLITLPAGSTRILVFTAGPMAVFYTGMCVMELRTIRRRAFFKLR